MKHVAQEQILSAIPLLPEMTRKQKLERWADLISECNDIALIHNLENWDHEIFNNERKLQYYGRTAFHVAADDPIFKKLGLIATVGSAIKFFEVSQSDLHEFSCDCGGSISATRMARYIRNIADPTWLGWFKNLFR
jgi:hypothetical protein